MDADIDQFPEYKNEIDQRFVNIFHCNIHIFIFNSIIQNLATD